jgi:sugar O-acyltransferase (sialic acid O-acetyltransferase NeuD family)
VPRKLVVFGAGDIAELAAFYFDNDSDFEVVAFTVDRDYLDGGSAFGRPLLPFDEIEHAFAPDGHDMFVALSYARLNGLRRDKVSAARAKGYRLASYVSSRATTFPGLVHGENCFILEDNTIQPFVTIGENVTLWSGNHVGHHSRIGDHCFVASHVVISGGVTLGEQCFVGVNVTIRDHVRIGDRCVLGAGALISADADADGVYPPAATERSRVPSHRLRGI